MGVLVVEGIVVAWQGHTSLHFLDHDHIDDIPFLILYR